MWCSNLFWLYWYTKQIQKCINFIVCFRSPFQSFPLWVMNSWAVIDTMKTVENLVYWKPFLVICPKSHFASIKDLHIQSECSIHYSCTKKDIIVLLNSTELPYGDLKKKIGPWWEDCTETWNLRQSTEKWNNCRILQMKTWILAEVVLFSVCIYIRLEF